MIDFPTELGVLTCLTLFAASLWIPYIVGVSRLADAPDNFTRPGDLSTLPAWIHRAHRAHLNLLEQFVPFAVIVLLLDRVGGFNAVTYWTAIAFFWLRVAHAIGMISGMAKMPVRPIIFTLGWVCIIVLGVQVFLAR